MELPKITEKKPQIVELQEGKTYLWCACGLTDKGAFCDGKHSGSGFKPKVFKAEKTETKALCQCKQTKNAPYCDGSHNKL